MRHESMSEAALAGRRGRDIGTGGRPADPDNRFHVATYYRTGPWTRALFLWDCGDCHLVHHVFDQIPFYRMGQAVDLLRPILLRAGVIQRTSLWTLLRGYYVDVLPHRARWHYP